MLWEVVVPVESLVALVEDLEEPAEAHVFHYPAEVQLVRAHV